MCGANGKLVGFKPRILKRFRITIHEFLLDRDLFRLNVEINKPYVRRTLKGGNI